MASAPPATTAAGASQGLAGFLLQELALLVVEARRKLPDAPAKDAAELLIALIKSFKHPSPSQQQSTSDSVAQELARTPDSVTPFILACESKTGNHKLSSIAIGCLQRMTMLHAMPESCVGKVLKSMADAALVSGVDQSVQLKVLQTVLPLLSGYLEIGGDVIAESIVLCHRLQDSKSPIVNSIASATLRQIVLHTFERVNHENRNPENSDPAGRFVNDAILLFNDLCRLAYGDTAPFLKVSAMPKNLCLELIESILASHSPLFKQHEALLDLLKESVCPMIMRSFSEKSEFTLSLRLIRTVHVVLRHLHDVLTMETEIFLSLFIKILDQDHGPSWLRVLVTESLRNLCGLENFLQDIYQSFDGNQNSGSATVTKLFADLLNGVAKVLVVERHVSLIIPREPADNSGNNAAPSTDNRGGAIGSSGIVTGAGTDFVCLPAAMVKVPCIELLDKSDAPNLPDNYLTSLCIQTILQAIESQTSLLPRLISANVNNNASATTPLPPIHQDELIVALEMAAASFPPIISVLAVILIGNVDADVFRAGVRAASGFATLVGLLGLVEQCEGLITTVCRIGVPASAAAGVSFDAGAAVRELVRVSAGAAQNFSVRLSHPVAIGGSGGGSILGDRNLSIVVACCNACAYLGPVLGQNGWYVVLETLQAVEAMHSAGRVEQRRDAVMVSGSTVPGSGHGGTLPPIESVKLMDGGRKLSLNSLAHVAAVLANSSGGGGNSAAVDVNLPLAIKNLFEGTQTMDQKTLKEFVAALCMLCKDGAFASASNTSEKKDAKSDDKLFSVSKLHEIALLNIPRIVDPPDEVFAMIVNCLIEITHSSLSSVNIRNQACTVFGDILTSAVQSAEQVEGRGFQSESVEMNLLQPLRKFMLVSPEDAVPTGVPISGDVDKVVKGAWFVEVQKVGLDTVKKILMSSGHNIAFGWFLIFEVLRSVVVGGRKSAGAGTNIVPAGAIVSMAEKSNDTVASQPSKASLLVKAAFPSLQLVCGDFLGSLAPEVLFDCIQTLGCFGSQPDDINISLTTIGLLWNISDNIISRRLKLEKGIQAETVTTEEILRSGTVNDLTILVGSNQKPPLQSNPRPEVRNTANQTIFKTITINGKRLSIDAWDECIWNILFPLMERVKISSSEAVRSQNPPPVSSSFTAGIIASPQESPTKFWNETKTITLTGITNLIVGFFPTLVVLKSGFEKVWSLFLEYIRSWALEDSPEVATAAIKNFRVLVRFPKDYVDTDGNPGKLPQELQSKLPELWRVAWDVWESIGVGILNETDERRTAKSPRNSVLVRSASGLGSALIPVERLSAIHGNFPHSTLVMYAQIVVDIHDVISPSFGLYELKQLLNVLISLLLYHTNLPTGATASKYRTDNVTDLDSMAPFQEAVLSLIVGTAPNFWVIKGAPEAIILAVAGFIRLPFVRLQSLTDAERQIARIQPQTGGMDKGFTYMSLAKRSTQLLVELFESHSDSLSIYLDGIFESILGCLDLPMRSKYDCPCAGIKEPTPLWRIAATASTSIVTIGLKKLETFAKELPKNILDAIYGQILSMFDGFLLPKSSPPDTMTIDDLEAATDFDIAIFETFETDVLLHLGRLHVPDDLVRRHVEIITLAGRLYKSHMASMPDLTAGAIKALDSTKNHGTDSQHGSLENVPLTRKPVRLDDVPAGSVPQMSMASLPGIDQKRTILGTDVISLGREKFAKECLVSLFGLCSDDFSDFKDTRHRIATIAAPIVLERLREIIVSYGSERLLYGRLPPPRIRTEEILLVLTHIRDLQMRVGILHELISEDKIR
ncbi:hypothetical protein HDU82_007111 [Entophlyctis luteolus]|nr:hypothetical protein HDU82_007111 [Entophlyctis luteolus]